MTDEYHFADRIEMTSQKSYISFITFFCILLLCTVTVSAKEILVGEHLGNSTITAALAYATNGDTITVTDGTYNENIYVNKEVTIRSQNGSANTTIQAASGTYHVFYVTANNVTISGFNITGATGDDKAGIYLTNQMYCTISNNTLTGNYHGIYLSSSSNNNLTNNNASENSYHGIFLSSSSNYNILTSNYASDNSYNGIFLSSSSNNNLTNNYASDNSYHGIFLSSSSNYNILTSNYASDNSYYGIFLSSSSNNNLTNNYASDNNRYGIFLRSSSNNNLTNNNASENSEHGIYLYSSSNYNILTSNNASDNTNYGIFLDDSSSNNLTNNNASENSEHGIFLDDSSSNNLTSNNVSNNDDYGIYLTYSSNYNTLTSNNANDNDCGIYLYSSSSNNLTSNTMSSNTYNFEVGSSSIENYLNDIDESNEVDGKPVYYWTNRADDIIPSTAGVVYVINSTNVTVKDIKITNEYFGVTFYSTTNSTIENVTVSECNHGIYLSSSSNNNLTSNNASNNSEHGIYLDDSSNNTLTSNNASDNNRYGIYLYSSSNYNILTSNNASDNNRYGIYLYYSSNYNILTSNNVSDNSYYGIFLSSSSNNNLTSNSASDNDGGIYLHYSSSNNLTSNNASNNDAYGIYLYYSSNYNTLTSNNANDNTNYGIFLDDSSSNNLTNNTMSSNTYNFLVSGHSFDNYLNDIDESNEVDGKPVYYWTNRADDVIPSTAGVVYVINSTNVTVKDIEITNEYYGVTFYSTTNSTIENVTVSEDNSGIFLFSSSSNNLTNNNASNNSEYGIYLDYSSNNILTENTATGNGIYNLYALYSSNCIVDKLVLTNISTQISTVTDSSQTGISGAETNANDLSGKTNINGYVTIARPDDLNVTFFYDDSGMSSLEESSVNLYRLNGSNWVEVAGTSLNIAGNNISANLPEFGTFGLFYGEDPSSSSSSGSSSRSVAARVRSQGTITTLPTSSNGELIGDTVVKSSDEKTTLTLYKGTVGTDASGNPVNRIIVTTPASLPSNTPKEVLESGLYYEFGPSGTSFNKEVIITIDFDPEEYESRNPVIYTYTPEGGWFALETNVDWENGRATAMISHFSLYALFDTDVEEVVEETPQITNVVSETVEQEEEIPVEDDNASSYLYWILGMGTVLFLGIVVLNKQKGERGL